MSVTDATQHPEDEQQRPNEGPRHEVQGEPLVRLLKPITLNPEAGKSIDERVVAPQFYNCFTYSLL